MIKHLLSSRRFHIGILIGILIIAGVSLYVKHERTHTTEKTQVPETQQRHEGDTLPHIGIGTHEHPKWIGPPPHKYSQEALDTLDTFQEKLSIGVKSGIISQEAAEKLLRRQKAVLATEGMPPFEAAQYLLNSPNIPQAREYFQELTDFALTENPDDPEVLFFWAGSQDLVKEGPNPEVEAAYEKLLAMDGIPSERRSQILDSFAGTIWYYKPKDAVRYIEEARTLSKNSYYAQLGNVYQRLGQYDKALDIYRDYYAKTGSFIAADHIRSIEAGTPNIPAIEYPVAETPGAEHPGEHRPAMDDSFTQAEESFTTHDSQTVPQQ